TNQLGTEGVLGGVENTRCSVVSKTERYADSNLDMFTARSWCHLAEFYASSIVLRYRHTGFWRQGACELGIGEDMIKSSTGNRGTHTISGRAGPGVFRRCWLAGGATPITSNAMQIV